MNCPKCNSSLPDDSLFCLYCGSKLGPEAQNEFDYVNLPFGTVVVCPKCGQKNMRTDKWCRNCDLDLTAAKTSIAGESPGRLECPQCLQGNPPGSGYCRKCGTPLETSTDNRAGHEDNEREVIREREIIKIRCPYCGTLNGLNAQNCSSCGARL